MLTLQSLCQHDRGVRGRCARPRLTSQDLRPGRHCLRRAFKIVPTGTDVAQYPDADYEKTCELIDSTTQYALTGALFARERSAIVTASNKLRNAAGNCASR